LDDLQSAFEMQLLSNLQFTVFTERFLHPKQTYTELSRRFPQLGSDQRITICLLRTSQLRFWDGVHNSPHFVILSDFDALRFNTKLKDISDEAKTVLSKDAADLLFQLRTERANSARSLLSLTGCPKLAARVKRPALLVSRHVLRKYVEKDGFTLRDEISRPRPTRAETSPALQPVTNPEAVQFNGNADWTPAEDQIICHAVHVLGLRWAAISALLPGRMENAVKNRWNSALRHQNREMLQTFGQDAPLVRSSAPDAAVNT
jgi:hypothetical protein